MSNGTPPITPAPVPPSVAGIPQPVFGSGSASSPATPIPITGSPLLPPPQVGMGGSVPTRIPGTTVPPSIAGIAQPVYGSGSATVPTAASLFPARTTNPPYPPIVFANIFKIGTVPPPLPSTPTQPPVTINGALVPMNIREPVVTGTPAQGQVLTVNNGGWVNYPTSYAYAWLRNGTVIGGQTTNTYTVLASDKGDLITAQVTATNTAGSAVAQSAAIVPLAMAA